jgi:hypothetical protein
MVDRSREAIAIQKDIIEKQKALLYAKFGRDLTPGFFDTIPNGKMHSISKLIEQEQKEAEATFAALKYGKYPHIDKQVEYLDMIVQHQEGALTQGK